MNDIFGGSVAGVDVDRRVKILLPGNQTLVCYVSAIKVARSRDRFVEVTLDFEDQTTEDAYWLAKDLAGKWNVPSKQLDAARETGAGPLGDLVDINNNKTNPSVEIVFGPSFSTDYRYATRVQLSFLFYP